MRNLIVAIAALLAPAAAFAGGYVVPNVNARDMALGGAAQAAQDSAGATYALPAALSRLDGLNLSGDVSLIDFRSTWRDPTNSAVSPVTMTPKGAFPPALYAAYGFALPNDMRMGVGAGLTIPGGGYVFWPGDWPGRNEIITVDRKVYGAYLTTGVQVLPQLRLGGGLIYYRTTEHLIQGLNFLTSSGQIELGTAGGALSYDLSAEVTPLPELPFTVAIDYKHQGVQTLTGHAHGTNIPAALLPRLQDQGVSHVLTYPNQLNVGAAYQVVPQLLLVVADWTWERFHVYRQDAFIGDRGVTVVVPRDYKNGYTFRLGAEVNVIPKLKARAGVLRDISPSRNSTLSPTLPDADSTALTLGLGYEALPGLELNAAYFHDWQDTKSTTGTGAFPGTYDTRANIWALNVTYRMGATR